jgi:hypothetical protein
MDDLQLKVSSPDRYIVRRNGDLDLDPVVRRIRDLTIRCSVWHMNGSGRFLASPFSGNG